MIARMRDEALNAHDGNRALPRDLAREVKRSADDLTAGARHDARDEPEAARVLRAEHAARERELAQQRRIPDQPRQPRERPDVRREPDVHLFDAERRVRRREPHVDRAQRVQCEPEGHAVHGGYHGLRRACGRADGVLEVPHGGARQERTARGVWVSRVCEEVGYCVLWPYVCPFGLIVMGSVRREAG